MRLKKSPSFCTLQHRQSSLQDAIQLSMRESESYPALVDMPPWAAHLQRIAQSTEWNAVTKQVEEGQALRVHSEGDLRSLFNDVLRVLLTRPMVCLRCTCHMRDLLMRKCATDPDDGPLQLP